jgi:hypothetical protein
MWSGQRQHQHRDNGSPRDSSDEQLMSTHLTSEEGYTRRCPETALPLTAGRSKRTAMDRRASSKREACGAREHAFECRRPAGLRPAQRARKFTPGFCP